MPNARVSLLEFSYQDLESGGETHGRLFINDNGKLEFEGNNVEESARVFFEECLKPMCEEHIELLIDKRRHPLFYWKENT